MSEPLRVAVLASGGGTNLQALLDRFNQGAESPARVVLVVGSRAGIGALDRARAAGVAGEDLDARELGPEAFRDRLLQALDAHAVELIVLAGWLTLVPLEVVRRYHGRMINIHPALLPAFGGQGMYGARVHRAVLAAGVRVTGVTVHFVDERYDEGAIIAQWPVPVLPGDTAESLATRVLAVEHRVLPLVVEALARAEPGVPHTDAPVCFELAAAEAPGDASLRRTLRLAHAPDGGGADPSST